MKARVIVTLKQGVLDPQGQAIEGALASLGFDALNSARQGKIFDLDVDETDPATARTKIEEMCEKLLANTVIENYTIDLI